MSNSYTMPKGKHEGKHISTVPPHYLKWVLKNWDFQGLLKFKAAIQEQLQTQNIFVGASPTKKKMANSKSMNRQKKLLYTKHSRGY